MSRQIDWTKPLSAEDKAWAEQFSIHHTLIQDNERQFAAKDDDKFDLAGGPDADDETEDYSSWTVAELKAELKDRELPVSGTQPELAARLQADDESKKG